MYCVVSFWMKEAFHYSITFRINVHIQNNALMNVPGLIVEPGLSPSIRYLNMTVTAEH